MSESAGVFGHFRFQHHDRRIAEGSVRATDITTGSWNVGPADSRAGDSEPLAGLRPGLAPVESKQTVLVYSGRQKNRETERFARTPAWLLPGPIPTPGPARPGADWLSH